MDPSIHPAWATNPTQSPEERPEAAIEGKRDLRLAGYTGILGNIMSWTGRVVTVVVHQEGKRDQIEYLDKGSVAATYLKLSGMTGISDRAEIVYKLSEDKEIQQYALSSLSQYQGGKIHVEKTGETKNLNFNYVGFSDLVKEKLFHIEVFLETKEGTEEKHFANPIAMASRCLERSGLIGVSDNPARVRELALQENIQKAAWESLENKHGSKWVKGEKDAQDEVVPFRYNMNKFIKLVGDVVDKPKHESFLTRLIHILFGRKEVASLAVKTSPGNPSEFAPNKPIMKQDTPPAHLEALSEEVPPEVVPQEESQQAEEVPQLPEINPEIVKQPVAMELSESEYEPMPLDTPTTAITDESVEGENGVVDEGADREQRTLQNAQDELVDLSNMPLESPEPLPVQEADLPEEEIEPAEINLEIVEQPVVMAPPESDYEAMPLDTPTTATTAHFDESVEGENGVVDEAADFEQRTLQNTQDELADLSNTLLESPEPLPAKEADLPESISVLPKSPQISTETEKMPPLRFQGVDLSKHLDATTASLLIRYLMTLYMPNYQPANTNFAALGNIQVTRKELSGKERTVGLQEFVKGLDERNQKNLKSQLEKYYGDQLAQKITGTGGSKTIESLLKETQS